MCTHQRVVYNKYTKDSFLCKCGKCKACLQEKAYKRAFRIKSEVSPDKIALFVTLTYDRGSCPYVLQEDIDARKDILPVYREFYTRRVKKRVSYGTAFLDKRYLVQTKLNDIYFPNYESFDRCSNIRHLAFRYNHVGICYFPDIQLFKKRLNINLKRIYKYDQPFKIYSCMEYGEITQRPHAHLLFFIRPQDETIFRTAIPQAWPFASKSRTSRYIEIARDVANYLASYVNSGLHFHKFLSDNFKAKHSYSKDFGMADKLFSLDSVFSKVSQRDLSYLRPVGPKGQESYVNLPIPKYVINRYFPLFKGYSRFTDSQILDVLRCFIQSDFKPKIPLIDLDRLLSIDYSKDDLHKICVRVTNAFNKWSRHFGSTNVEDFIYNFRETWKVYKNTCLRLWYEDNSVPPKYRYDNSDQLNQGIISSPDTLDWLKSSSESFIHHPNDYPTNIQKTRLYENIYDFRCKEKKVNNFVMSKNNYFF